VAFWYGTDWPGRGGVLSWLALLGCLRFWIHVKERGKSGVPLLVLLPRAAFEPPFYPLRDEFFADPVKVGEHSIDQEPYRVCCFLCVSKADIEVYGIREIRREKGVFPKEVFGIRHILPVSHKVKVAVTKRYWKSSGVNQLYSDPQNVITWMHPSFPIGEHYPLIELGLHQIRLFFDCFQGFISSTLRIPAM
jgi:hypothetical protein